MKTLALVGLTASLLANAVLAYFVVGHSLVPSPVAAPVASVQTTTAKFTPASIDPATWSSLQTTDLPELVSRLREAGFPPDVIRAIVAGQLREALDLRRKALLAVDPSVPFWKNSRPKPGVQTTLHSLERENRQELKALLGDDALAESSPFRDRQLRGLPPAKVDDVRHIMRDFDEKRNDLFAGGLSTPADREKLNSLEREQRSAIAQLLTPDELLNYQLYSSTTANSLRNNLAGFNPTEEEFRTLFKLTQPFDDQYSYAALGGMMGPEQMKTRSEAQKQLNEQIKEALGPERAEAYVRTTDLNYRQTAQLVERLELAPQATDQVWAVQQDVQQRMKALYTDNSLPADQRKQALATLAEEAKTRISASLGDRGYEAYKQYGGQWMQQLTTGRMNVPVVRGDIRFMSP